ncbi:uncharacterized protein LOC108865004 [Galendromus occidentalis]|uniref:Uncharacterized protein LOC108865004 n=1 Tax=Galendromus occidentalis TaxID=34638 RepID=A0AAJ7L7A1_9ACAR|nr:uncharacterized protein LOC108865004 [Galendromus occidentalis]
MFAALAFVPPAELNSAVTELAPLLPPELTPVLNYFEDVSLERLNRVAPDGAIERRAPRFPVEMWSVLQRTLDGEARTDNYAEAAHRRMQLEFGVSHPTLWKFIDGLRKIQKNRDFQMEQYIGGATAPKKRNTCVEADRKILEAVRDASNSTDEEYLRGVSRNFFLES